MEDEQIEIEEGEFRKLMWEHTVTNPNPTAIKTLLGPKYKLITRIAGCENGFRRMIQNDLCRIVNQILSK